MNSKVSTKTLAGACALLSLAAVTAFADDGIDVNITNDGIQDIVVTVYDMNTQPHGVVLSHARINGFTTIPVSVSPGDSGVASVSWTAISADSRDRKCGHGNNVTLDSSASVKVHADAICSESTAAATSND